MATHVDNYDALCGLALADRNRGTDTATYAAIGQKGETDRRVAETDGALRIPLF
ncbi:hypothetical protein D9M71_453250 [compost metagenome]